jgi:hypothetical protein
MDEIGVIQAKTTERKLDYQSPQIQSHRWHCITGGSTPIIIEPIIIIQRGKDESA